MPGVVTNNYTREYGIRKGKIKWRHFQFYIVANLKIFGIVYFIKSQNLVGLTDIFTVSMLTTPAYPCSYLAERGKRRTRAGVCRRSNLNA